MSFDRVLPKPAALHYDSPQVTLPRPTSNLLEHKIMNDNVSKVSMLDRHLEGVPVGSSCRYAADGLPQVHLSSLNRAKIALNKIASNAPIEPPKPAAPLPAKSIPFRERSSVSERSSSSSPVKSATSRESVTQFCLCQPDPKIPRPRNAFILYRQHYQAAVVAQNPGLANPDISKIIGEQWRRLPQETKDEWKALAEEEKARHQQQYPEYRYQPRRYGRDGNPRGSSSGISHNPPGSTVCSRCGGRVMNPPVSPEAPFNPNGSSHGNGASLQHDTITGRSYPCRAKDSDRPSNPIKMGSNGDSLPPRQRQWEETVNGTPDSKRRRISTQLPGKASIHRDRSPDGSYPISSYTTRPEAPGSRGSFHMLQPPRPYRGVQDYPQPDPSLKLPPLQTTAPVSSSATPVTQYGQEGSSLEATVMTIPFLNKIKVLAKISPPLLPSFRDGASRRRGAVVSVDGQDPVAVKSVIDFLNNTMEKEGKYHTHIFEGPDIRLREGYSESGQMGDATVDYLNTISAWHRISDEIVGFVKPSYGSLEPKSVDEDSSTPGASPKGSISKGAEIHISSPAQSSENGSVSYSSSSGSAPSTVPVALVPRYQLTTADAFACSVPIGDSYAPLDHWQWMASLWRACVGPDITVYVRECEKDELDRFGGNPVEVRLHDARTIVVRRAAGSPRELEEKTLKRVGFEIEDYLTQ
ncbi:putative HMG box protein [Aspergillus nomiae NRRL 13137]|uniref:Putative HMG box protein n=1 Tax=Aspergillus nomiae NRRL (strain ATCC 15546 / NRRL 13137 / CBS 260.88 / M93) TaxID=1509407 RepID=A0A0L1IRM6_ASPN3|nr:putative HMG box protein [Aspergillus nomiae NRRL 13137]KNG82139.1 putative HMG box protein [Aspergillus nomiae NRRL 13137]